MTGESTKPFSNQHVVSRVLLRQFAEGKGVGKVGVLRLADLDYCEKSPTLVGTVANLVPVNAERYERRWGQVERMIPHALDLVKRRTVLADRKFARALSDFLVLHFARGHSARVLYESAMPAKRQQVVMNLLQAFPAEQIVFELTGLVLPSQVAAGLAPQLIAASFDERIKQDNFMGDALLGLFNQGRALSEGNNLEIWYAQQGSEFLLGDIPAVSYSRSTDSVGVLDGVPWSAANTIVMPLGPQVAIALAKESGYFEADQATVVAINKLQIRGAYEEVVVRPASGLGPRLQHDLSCLVEDHHPREQGTGRSQGIGTESDLTDQNAPPSP